MKTRFGLIVVLVLISVLGVIWLFLVRPGVLRVGPVIVDNDPQPPTQGRLAGPQRDEVASDLIGRPIYTYAVHALAFSDDSAFLALGAGDGGVMRIDLAMLAANANDPMNPPASLLAAHDDWAFAIDFLEDGSIITGGGDNLLIHWDQGLQKRHTFDIGGHTNDVHALAVSPDQSRMYSAGDDHRLIAWDLRDGAVLYDIAPHEGPVPALVLSSDGAVIATGSRDDKVRLFDAQTGDLLHTLDPHDDDVLDLAFSPDGSWLASASYDTTVRIYEVETGGLIQTLRGSNSRQFAAAYSADGRYLAAGGESGKIVIYDASDDYAIVQRIRTDGDVSRLAFSPDGQWFASASSTGVVILYDAQMFEEIQTLRYEIVEDVE
ncbi:MAG: WD40 repeat domain-containing protein [Phycisphaerales bacterium JB063]